MVLHRFVFCCKPSVLFSSGISCSTLTPRIHTLTHTYTHRHICKYDLKEGYCCFCMFFIHVYIMFVCKTEHKSNNNNNKKTLVGFSCLIISSCLNYC